KEDGKQYKKKSDYPTSTFWKRLQSVKMKRKMTDDDVKLFRVYQSGMDFELMKKRTFNQVATLNIYMKGKRYNEDCIEDILDIVSLINENDVEYKIKYMEFKKKKYAQVSNRLEEAGKTDVKRTLAFLNLETGELKK